MNRRELLLGALAPLALSASETAPKLTEGKELLGEPAPPLQLSRWVNGNPLEMSDLRGKVVLLRWWTQGCPMCEATGPALRKFQSEYGGAGLQVIGIYHPKPAGNWSMNALQSATKEKEFTFPVALDGDWTALKRWWLTRDRDYTSVSFLVDRKGIIRYIHPGGEFHEGNQGAFPKHDTCQRDFAAVRSEIQKLLAE